MAKKRKLKKKAKFFLRALMCIAIIFLVAEFVEYIYLSGITYKPKENHDEGYYYAYDFGFIDKKSDIDYNQNGKDDYTDILDGLKEIAKINPEYSDAYFAGGYPPEGKGVCTDVIWYAIDNAGYNLKDMIDKDVREAKEDYPLITIIDTNIDFRRVSTQYTFFTKYLKTYSNDYDDIMEFNPGDILTFDDADHIAMVSDKRNAKGIPYLIQNRDETQTEKEEDRLEITEMEVTGHFRFEYTDKLISLIHSI